MHAHITQGIQQRGPQGVQANAVDCDVGTGDQQGGGDGKGGGRRITRHAHGLRPQFGPPRQRDTATTIVIIIDHDLGPEMAQQMFSVVTAGAWLNDRGDAWRV